MVKKTALRRAAFTLLELTVSVAIVGMLIIIVAQCVHVSVRERVRTMAHQAASELAANVLEEARAQPFEKLDQKWADARSVPTESADLLPEGKLIVSVAPEKGVPQVRRVTVEVRWTFEEHLPGQSVSLTTLLSNRETKTKGDTP